jgi:polyribonucleotide nucleotidyltransferase
MKSAEQLAQHIADEWGPLEETERVAMIVDLKDWITAYASERLKAAAEYAAHAVRNAALEEAAKVSDEHNADTYRNNDRRHEAGEIANHIRDLKSTPAPGGAAK